MSNIVNIVNSEGKIVPSTGNYYHHDMYYYSHVCLASYHIDDELKWMNALKALEWIKRYRTSEHQQDVFKQHLSILYDLSELEFKLKRFAVEELNQWIYEDAKGDDEEEERALKVLEKRSEKIEKYIKILEELKKESLKKDFESFTRKQSAIFMNNKRTMSVRGNIILYS